MRLEDFFTEKCGNCMTLNILFPYFSVKGFFGLSITPPRTEPPSGKLLLYGIIFQRQRGLGLSSFVAFLCGRGR